MGSQLKRYREQKGLSLKDVARYTNKTDKHIYQIELGIRPVTIALLYDFMTLYEVDSNMILGVTNIFENSIDYELEKLPPVITSILRNHFLQLIKEFKLKTKGRE